MTPPKIRRLAVFVLAGPLAPVAIAGETLAKRSDGRKARHPASAATRTLREIPSRGGAERYPPGWRRPNDPTRGGD